MAVYRTYYWAARVSCFIYIYAQFSLVIFKVKKLNKKTKDRDLIKTDHMIPYYLVFQERPVFKLLIIYETGFFRFWLFDQSNQSHFSFRFKVCSAK